MNTVSVRLCLGFRGCRDCQSLKLWFKCITIVMLIYTDLICETDVNPETNTCYWTSIDAMNWEYANRFCQAERGFLAHMKTHTAQEFVRSYGIIGYNSL